MLSPITDLVQLIAILQLTDTTRARYEVDINAPVVTRKASSTDYTVHINNSPAGVIVTRKSTGSILWV